MEMDRQPFDSSHASLNDFDLHGFIDSENFDQFFDIFSGENVDFVNNYDGHIMYNAQLIENQLDPIPVDTSFFDSGNVPSHQIFDSLPPNSGNVGAEEEENDSDDTTTTKKRPGDRSRTLVSERKRRGRMKEKLYALRALVPNITKMDKASIVGDAVLYVRELQMQAKKLASEITTLELSLKGQPSFEGSMANTRKTPVMENKRPACKKIAQMDVFQVEHRVYYVRLACNKEEGIAPALYKALDSLTFFDVNTSNLASESEQYILTFTINVTGCGEEMDLSTMKLWVTGALMNQGFQFRPHITA